MARTDETVRGLVDEDPEMKDALRSVRAVVDEDGAVEWSDVREDLSSGQWGRLIETGVLVDEDGGFRLADDDAVASVLENGTGDVGSSEATSADEDDEGGWSTYDKLALAASFGMILGYSYGPVKNAVGETVDFFFGFIASSVPFYLVILLAAVVTGVLSTLVQSKMTSMGDMEGMQERREEIQERKEAAKERDDEEALEEIREEEMELVSEQFGMFTQNFRPMVWIMLVTIPLFLWMYWLVGNGVTPDTMVMPMIGETQWNSPANPIPFPAWILWYFLCSMSFSNLIRKSLNLQTTPG